MDQCREKLREEFLKNSHVTDIRVIDMLVIKVGCIISSVRTEYLEYLIPFAFIYLGTNGIKRNCGNMETERSCYVLLQRFA